MDPQWTLNELPTKHPDEPKLTPNKAPMNSHRHNGHQHNPNHGGLLTYPLPPTDPQIPNRPNYSIVKDINADSGVIFKFLQNPPISKYGSAGDSSVLDGTAGTQTHLATRCVTIYARL